MSCPSSLSRRQLVALLAAFGVAPEAVEAQDAAKTDPRNYRTGRWTQVPACLGPEDCPHFLPRDD